MFDRLLTEVESLIIHSSLVMKITEKIAGKLLPQATVLAGEYCGCTSNCTRKEWKWYWVVYPDHGCWHCVEVGGSCQPC